jgi:hypothetical protein
MRWIYLLLVGIFFGALQTAYFFRLSFALASTYNTFLMVTLAWLAGSLIGLRVRLPLRLGSWLCLMPYLLAQVLVNGLPYRADLWPIYAMLVLFSGIFSGLFFAQMGEVVRPVRRLFFIENNGFIIGLVGSTFLYLVGGRVLLWIAPIGLAVLCWLYTPEIAMDNEVSSHPMEVKIASDR